ncbi:sulfite exporter TauE/SafE family protein [Oleisolibacter albus]|uniref:sulfite exporter TauE/SafE family protein n=1 Tax=Oleisolibacter albus TaxID=2171757 RepID=UPI000DF321CA|nr:sulfite exporter TauE/SafE family protein [Oleisolibacter albus]
MDFLLPLLPTLPQALGLVAVGAVAGLIRGLTGFGAALVIVPGLSLFLDPTHAVAVNILAVGSTNIPLLAGARREADYRTVGWFFAACVVALPFGVHLLTVLPAQTLETAIGVSVILASLLLSRPRFRLAKAGPGLKLGAGALSGLMNGAVGMGGPPVILLLLALPIPPVVTRASLILHFTLLNLLSLTALVWNGLIDARTMVLAGILIPPLLAMAWLGERWFRRSGGANFRPIAIGVLLVTGIAALLD